ncbi:MAG: flagellar motor protein MotB [Alphaproteobacteria bacterium]|nr:flagellar motor protein MotB [Alphaproteobacteria bacterium]
MADESGGDDTPIVIKKIVKGGGHHGGAWKVAYADFVTAMMAFFLLMWLLNVTDVEQKNAISNYFSPSHPTVSQSESGAGGVMGGLSVATEGAMATNIQELTRQKATGKGGADEEKSSQSVSLNEDAAEQLQAEEDAKLEAVKAQIESAISQNPELSQLMNNLIVDMTPEGLRIQVVDSKGKPMFPSGSARMYQKTRELMMQVGEAIKSVPNEISIRGHTDSIPYGSSASYTNWELSTDRANASRRVLQDSGIPANRLNNVVGKADTEHLLPDDPTNARNRRISIMLLKEQVTDPEGFKKRVEALASKKRAQQRETSNGDAPNLPTSDPTVDGNGAPRIPKPKSGSFNQTEGNVQFP